MNVPKHIKRFWMWVGVALLIELAAIMLWKRWYWFFPTHAVSGVYTKYAGTDGLNVVFFKDFKVNDTVFVDVTLLQAKDSADWERLVEDFGLTESVRVIPDKPSIIVRRVSKDNPYTGIHSPDEPFNNLVAVPDKREIHLYCTENEQQSLDLYMHLILKYMTTSKTQNNQKDGSRTSGT